MRIATRRAVALAVVSACALFPIPASGSQTTEETGCDSVPPSRQVIVYSGFGAADARFNVHSFCRSETAVLTPGSDTVRVQFATRWRDDLPNAVLHGLGFDGLSIPLVEGKMGFGGYWYHGSAVLQIPEGALASGCLRVELISQEHSPLAVQYRTAGVLSCT